MSRSFDRDAISLQIENLIAERERIDNAIRALELALRTMEGGHSVQQEFPINPTPTETTLQNAVGVACGQMIDGITRGRVINAIQRNHPLTRPNSSSVGAALINLTKRTNPMLHVAVQGKGRSPSIYTTEETITVRLSADEIETLMDPSAVKGAGGWQTLWAKLQAQLDKASGIITLTPELRARIFQYYHSYGQGGWQNKASRTFRRVLPHVFATQ